MKRLKEEELVLEALAGFKRIWELNYPEKGSRVRRKTSLDITGIQEAWNTYIRLNRKYHGAYVPASDPMFLK